MWISIKDQMPLDRQDVLVHGKLSGNYNCIAATVMAYPVGSVWYTYDGYDLRLKVTHWMPLPEPPSCG